MKDKIIKTLKEKEDYISGEYLSNIFDVSRTTIWKYINELRKLGYEIESITNRGYRLISSPDILTLPEINSYLNTSILGRKIIYFNSIDSTNTYAKRIAHTSKDGTIIISEEQLEGRGRMGRDWISPKGKGIWMSIILKPNIDPSNASKITLIASASIIKALENMNIKSTIKWPNDILINRKKIAGILTEMNCELDLLNYLVVGIGINVNLDRNDFSDELLDKATSIKMECKNKIDRKKLVANILNEFEKMYIHFKLTKDLEKVIQVNRDNLVFINEDIKILKNGEVKIVRAIDLNDDGELIVEDEKGNIEEIFSGEISIRGLAGYI